MEENHESNSASDIKDTLLGISGCLIYLVFIVGALSLLMAFFKGVPWIEKNVYPWVLVVSVIEFILVVPISVILAFFKKTRPIGGLGLFLSSYVVGTCLWVWSLIVAYFFAGTFWMIVGLFLGGIGIVPIAFVATVFNSEWSFAGQILLLVVITFALRSIGNYLIGKQENSGTD